MHKRRVIWLLIAGVVLAGVLGVVWNREPPEPEYGGKKLSEWVEDLPADGPRVQDHGAERRAEDAVRHIGTNALPCLLRWIRYEKPPWRLRVERACCELPYAVRSRIHLEPPEWRVWAAAEAIAILGPKAKAAVPELTRLLVDSKRTSFPATLNKPATHALAHVGQEALWPLLVVATNKALADREYAIGNLTCLGTNALPAVPTLILCLNDTNKSVAGEAARVLSWLGLESTVRVLALTNMLGHSNAYSRLDAVRALGGFRSRAALALPALEKLLTDPDVTVRAEAAYAIRMIAMQKDGGTQ